MLRAVLDLLAPRACPACRQPGPDTLCESCRLAIRIDATPRAQVIEGVDVCTSFLWLEGAPIEWLHRFKYPAPGIGGLDGPARAVVLSLVDEFAKRIDGLPRGVFVPIPLYPRRMRARGFNPAAVIAARLAEPTRGAFDSRLLVRSRDTPAQAGLGREERLTNLLDAFACRRRSTMPERVCLVDDVVTTGSTLRAGALALRAAGVRQVIGLTLARTRAGRPPLS